MQLNAAEMSSRTPSTMRLELPSRVTENGKNDNRFHFNGAVFR